MITDNVCGSSSRRQETARARDSIKVSSQLRCSNDLWILWFFFIYPSSQKSTVIANPLPLLPLPFPCLSCPPPSFQTPISAHLHLHLSREGEGLVRPKDLLDLLGSFLLGDSVLLSDLVDETLLVARHGSEVFRGEFVEFGAEGGFEVVCGVGHGWDCCVCEDE